MAVTDTPGTVLPPEFRATHRFARISASKVRRVARLLAGRPVNDALSVLRHVPNRGAPMLRKVLASAVANAERAVTEGHLDVDLNDLVVATAYVDGGPIMKRWRPAARGAPSPRRKRFCHISVVLRPPAPSAAGGEE